MSKDQTIGALILILCAIIIVGYVTTLFLYPICIQPWLNLGANANVQFWLIATPVLIAFIAILAIGAWIGYTMATTPPPKPIEEFNATTENADKTEQTKNATLITQKRFSNSCRHESNHHNRNSLEKHGLTNRIKIQHKLI